MKRAYHLNSCATMLQCLYRTRTSRKYFQQLQQQALKRKATLLQKWVRGFVVRQWVGRLKRRVLAVRADLNTVSRGVQPLCHDALTLFSLDRPLWRISRQPSLLALA